MTDTSLTSVPGLGATRTEPVRATPQRRGDAMHRRGENTPQSIVATLLVLATAVVVALRSDASPVGGDPTDAILTVGWVALMTLAGTRARSRALVVFAGCSAAAAAPHGGLVAALVALAVAGTALVVPVVRSGEWRAPVGAVAAALASCAFLEGTELRAGWAVLLGALGTLAVLVSARSQSARTVRHLGTAAFVLVVLAALGAVAGFGLAALDARADATEGIDHLKAGLDAAKDSDVDTARAELAAARDAMQHTDATLSKPWARAARHVPVVGQNARAVGDLASLATNLAVIAERAADSADLEAIASDAGNIDLVKLRQVSDALAELDGAVGDARTRLAALDSPWLAPPLVDKLDEARTKLDNAAPSITNVRDAAGALPALLGDGKGARYLLLFGTPVEARGRTGFPGNWAEVIAIDGAIRMTRFGRLVELNDVGVARDDRRITGLDDYLTRYGQFLPAQYWQNVPMSPDVPTVARAAAQLYPQSGGGKVDGVAFIDVEGIVKLLELSGPVKVDLVDEELSAANAADFLLRRQYLELPNDARIDLLEQVARATLTRLTSEKLPGLRTVADVMGDAVAKGHVRFVSFDERVAPLLERTRVDGALDAVDGDDVMAITNNAGGNRIDLFLQRNLAYDVKWDPATGSVDGTLTVTLKNDAPSSGLPKSLIGNAIDRPGPFQTVPPAGTNRMWLSLYSAFLPDSVRVDNNAAVAEFAREAGRNVASLVVDVPARGTRTVTLHWKGNVGPGDRYTLGLPAQPLPRPDTATVRVTIAGATPRTVDTTLTLDRDRRVDVLAP